jgi:hypothetical protein
LNFQDPESLQGQNSEDRFFLGDWLIFFSSVYFSRESGEIFPSWSRDFHGVTRKWLAFTHHARTRVEHPIGLRRNYELQIWNSM